MSFHLISFIHACSSFHFQVVSSSHSFIHSFVHSFIHSFIHSSIHSFIPSFICSFHGNSFISLSFRFFFHSFFPFHFFSLRFPFFLPIFFLSFPFISFHFISFHSHSTLALIAAFMAPSVISFLVMSNHSWSIHSRCCNSQTFPISDLFLTAMSLFRNFPPRRVLGTTWYRLPVSRTTILDAMSRWGPHSQYMRL